MYVRRYVGMYECEIEPIFYPSPFEFEDNFAPKYVQMELIFGIFIVKLILLLRGNYLDFFSDF